MIDTIRQLKFMPVSTSRTVLGSVSRVDLDAMSTGPFCLVTQTFKKLTPCYVSNGFVNAPEIIFLHIVDRQVFNGDCVEPVYKFTRKLMGKVVPLICNSFVNKSNRLFGFSSFGCSFGLLRQSSLDFSKFLFFLSEEPRIGNLLPIRHGCKVHKSHVNSDRRFDRLFDRGVFNNANECYKPFSGGCSSDGTSFDGSFDWSVKFDFNSTYLRKLNNIFEKFEPGLRIRERIVLIIPPESWISRIFSVFNSTEERLKRKVKSKPNILKNLAVNVFKKWLVYLKLFKCIKLVETRSVFFVQISTCSCAVRENDYTTIYSRQVFAQGLLSVCEKEIFCI